MYSKALNLLTFKENEAVLEIGIGNGKFLKLISKKVPNGLVTGIDISSTMLFLAKCYNFRLIRQKKVQIWNKNVENLNFEKESFDKIISLNTIYFWKNPTNIIEQLYHVLKPNGQLLLAFNSKKEMIKSGYNSEIFTFYELSEVENLLKEANFTIIQSRFEQFKIEDCYCIIAQKIHKKNS
jgi:ubiquinone/menaquinone biosynthesis C-methylase UbiE